MVVIHIVEAFGGGVVEFIRLLIEYTPKNYKHTVFYAEREISSDSLPSEFYKDNVELVKWNHAQREISLFKDIRAYRALNVFLNEKTKISDDICVHLHSSKAGILGRFWGIFNRGINIIYTPNGAPFARKDISVFKRFTFIIIEFLASKACGRVVCVSLSEKSIYNQAFIKADFINNGIVIKNSINFYQEKLKNNSEDSKIRIVTIGRITHQKNPHLFNLIAQGFLNNDKVEFIWVGDGELRTELSSPNIKITGWIDKQEIYQKLFKADIYLSTALWEGLPFAVLEAMDCYLPLLLYKSVGNEDLVINGYNGYLFESFENAYEAIEVLLNDKEIRNGMGLNSAELLRNEFDAIKMSEKYIELYEKR